MITYIRMIQNKINFDYRHLVFSIIDHAVFIDETLAKLMRFFLNSLIIKSTYYGYLTLHVNVH